ncbi:MAG: GGDEF domain-containing protein, partial [Actinomycetota bacterium]
GGNPRRERRALQRRIEEFAPVIRRLRSPLRAWIAALSLITAGVTAVAYALPLDQDANDTASNLSFTVMMVWALSAVAVAIRSTSGPQRTAWTMILVSFAVTAGLFAIDPQIPDGDLTIALDVAVLPSLAFGIAVLTLCLPVLPNVATVRTATDVLWLGTALIVLFWAPVVEPVVDITGRSDLERLAHLGFVGTTLVLTLSILVVLPNVRGGGRLVLWFLGLGGGMVSIAGVLHIQFFYEGSLRFGSAFDFLWTAGIGSLTVGALLAGEHPLEFKQRGLWWNVGLTAVPLGPAVYALLQLDHETDQPLAVALITALGLRVLALLFENDGLNRSLAADAANDPLTGLANRRTMLQGIGGVGATAVRRKRHRAVLSIDLDRFKAVNDEHGHLVGDRVLAVVGERLRHGVRGDAALIRFGGDEFLVAIDITSPDQAERAGERIRQAVAGAYVIDELVITIDATIGIALDDGRQPVNTMLEAADQALYAAKAAGRGRVLVQRVEPAVSRR